jgi:uncharacterized protein YdaU (DUF1376 family)
MRDRHPWYKHYPADFLNGVEGIGPDTIGCYIVILDMLYDRGEPVPNDARLIGGRLGCSARLARVLIGRLLDLGKLFEAPDGLTNNRAEMEISTARLNRLKLLESGAKGGRKRAENERRSRNINGIGQATLKHRARGQIPEEESFLLLQSSTQAEKQEGSAEKKQAEDPALLSPSSALLATKLVRKAS